MTARDDAGAVARVPRLRYAFANLARWIGALLAPPRPGAGSAAFVPVWRRYGPHLAVSVVAVAATMIWIDAAAMAAVPRLPGAARALFGDISDLGLSGWFLVPVGVLILIAAFADVPRLDRWSRLVLATFVVRLGFVFVAIGLPGLIGTTIKRLIGRVRPSPLGPFAYEPLSWRAAYASLPSGHAITAFSALVAIGTLFPRLRGLCWLYALLIAVSRVVVFAHFPSDVLAGAVFGAFGALLVRDWFAQRRLGFSIGPAGEVEVWPPPRLRRLKGVARGLSAS